MEYTITSKHIQQQLIQRQHDLQNLTVVVNNMVQNHQDIQAAIQKLLANQGNQGIQQPEEALQNEDPIEPQNLVLVIPPPPPVASAHARLYTLEKFIKNGAKTFKVTVELDKVEAWTLNMVNIQGNTST